MLNEALDDLRRARRHRRRGQRRCGGWAASTSSRPTRSAAETLVPPLARAPPRRRRPDDGGVVAAHDRQLRWSASIASTTPVPIARHALQHFQDAGDVSGITLVLDDLALIEAGAGRVERSGRLWGAARRLQQATGTALADYVEQTKRPLRRPDAADGSRRRRGPRAAGRRGRRDDPRRGRRLCARGTLRRHRVDPRGGDLTMLEPAHRDRAAVEPLVLLDDPDGARRPRSIRRRSS